VDELYAVMGIDLDDREPELLLLRRLDALRERLPQLTLSWAGPFAAYLAEVYDHALLPAYQQLESELAARRREEERAVLLADEPPAVARLVSTGLLPL